MRKKIIAIIVTICLLFSSIPALGHSGRTDSSGGHRDNKNVSGLGYYHYHCGGNPPHLHNGGICPYKKVNYSSSYSPTQKIAASVTTVQSKPRLSTPVISVQGKKTCNYISWDKVKNAKNYSVYRATSKSGTYEKIATTTKLHYYDKTAKKGKTYYYKVKAFNAGKYTRSYFSKIKSAKVLAQTIKLSKTSANAHVGDIIGFWIEFTGDPENVLYSYDENYLDLKYYPLEDFNSGYFSVQVLAGETHDINTQIVFTIDGYEKVYSEAFTLTIDNPDSIPIWADTKTISVETGGMAWFAVFTDQPEKEIIVTNNDNWLTCIMTETETKGAVFDMVIIADEESTDDEEVTTIDFAFADSPNNIVFSMEVVKIAD